LLYRDKKVLNRIICIIVLGVMLEIGFAVLSLVVSISTAL
jgi:hypothetical protein